MQRGASKTRQRERWLLVGSVLAIAVAILVLWVATRPRRTPLRLAAGDLEGHRTEVAEVLVELADARGLRIDLAETDGSAETLEHVADHTLDLGLVQGGLPTEETVREVAPLVLEPLHVLVRGEVHTLAELEGLRIQLAPPGSGTRQLALEVLGLAGLIRASGHAFTEVRHSYDELEMLEDVELPDAIFHVSALPSPNAHAWIRERGYRLLPLPIAAGLRLQNIAVHPSTIPAYTYGSDPATPPDDVPTPGTRMLLVAHRDVDRASVRTLLEILDSGEFARRTAMPRRERMSLFDDPEFPLHTGTEDWLRRNDPYFTAEQMGGLEDLRSFLVSLAVAAYLLYRWMRSRRLHGLDAFLAEVSRLDENVLALERSAALELGRLLELRAQLGEVKARALRSFADGNIHSEELLSSFLTHVSDVRSHLNAMILSERERLQKQARTERPAAAETRMAQLWRDALEADPGDDDERTSLGPTDRASRTPARPPAEPPEPSDEGT